MHKYLLALTFSAVLACSVKPRQDRPALPVALSADTLIDFENLRDPAVKHIVLSPDDFKADYTVLDGLLVAADNRYMPDGQIVRVQSLKDSAELADLGVAHPAKAYKFLYSEPTEFYRYAYLKVRDTIPLRLLDMQFPLFIDGRVVPLSQSGVADRLNRNAIRKIEFFDKSAPEISGDSTIVFGVIKIML